MKSLVLIKNGVLELKDIIIEDNNKSNWVLVRIVASGVCGSDMHRAFENGAYHTPLVMGHEFTGIIEKMPTERFSTSSKLKEGDRVVVFPLLPCRKCEPCSSGDFAQCTSYDYFGSRRDGGFAEFVYVPEENLIPIPPHVETVHAAMTEPCAVALHGVRKMRIIPGATGAVFGAGPIGLMVAQWLRILGCGKVFVSDIDERKISLARKLGFIAINPKHENPVDIIFEQSHGGAQHIVEACGLPQTFLQAIQSAGRGGQIVFMGNIQGNFQIGQNDFSTLLRKELSIFGTWNSKITPIGLNDWTTALEMMDKEMHVKELISHLVPLEEGPFILKKMHERDGFFNKVIFKIS